MNFDQMQLCQILLVSVVELSGEMTVVVEQLVVEGLNVEIAPDGAGAVGLDALQTSTY